MKKDQRKQFLNLDKIDYKILLISYLLINLAFLYHSFNFMWGNHDVEFIKNELLLSSGLFEGRFTQFIPHRLLTSGQILPILNNLLGLGFLTLGLWLLAKYWNIPRTTSNYVIFITFFATLPFTLSWLYFTFITISCLLWIFVAVMGLYLSAIAVKSPHKYLLNTLAILCFYCTLGGYPPIINTIFVCWWAKITISYLIENKSIKKLFLENYKTLINIIISIILFKLTLKLIHPDGVYNLQTTAVTDIPEKIISTLKISLKQFIISLPFMGKTYKILLLMMVSTSFIGALIKAKIITKILLTTICLCITVWCAALTTLLVTPHTEFVARIDFYGLAFVYAFALALLFSYKAPFSKSLALIFMTLLLPLNILNNYQAQKVWQQGFTAEFQILDQVIERIENHPDFNPEKQYRFYQIGDVSLRQNYYHQKYDKDEPFLLSLPYLAMWQGGHLLEFYSPFNYIDHHNSILPTDITPEVSDFIKNKARPWPHENAIFINNDIIFIIYNQSGLTSFINQIDKLPPIY